MLGRLFCWIGWHWRPLITGHDGCSIHATCTACGALGMFDSQGNFFASREAPRTQ